LGKVAHYNFINDDKPVIFADSSLINDYAQELLYNEEILTGYIDGSYN
jgi:hypothetical protein